MPCLSVFLLHVVLICCSACPLVVQAKLFVDCTFGDVQSSKSAWNMSALSMTFSGQLPSRNVSYSCLLKTDNRNSLLYLRAKRSKESKEGSLHVSVYGTDKAPFQLGHLDISRSSVGWNSLPICPSSSASDKYLTFRGTPGLNFTVKIVQEENINLDERKGVIISPSNRVGVFQFIPTEDISDTQLDVTVTSESADVPAYLKVSRDCKDVKDNIDDVDYKGESLRLSFAKKGRITLSKVSIPPLTDSTSSWFIGIAIKNINRTMPFDATKIVTLELAKSFDYSYATPLWISAFVISFFFGVVVSLWAWYSFREYLDSPCTAEEEVTCSKFFLAMKDVICSYSLGRGPKTYSYVTLIAGSVLMVGALQFVLANWYLMIHEGDRDNCYYNDFCYRVRYADIPYNLMISNLTYFIHGLMLAVNVWCMESQVLARCRKLAANAKCRDDAKKHANKSDQTIPDQNQPSKNQHYAKRPRHALKCPDSSPHLEKILVPTIENEESREDTKRPDDISDQTRPDQNHSRRAKRPRHAFRCPDSSPHLGRMLAPQWKIEHEEGRDDAKRWADKAVQTIPDDQNQSPENETYAELPSHVLRCPDISLHLEKMRVPQCKIKNEEAVEIFAEARKKKFTFTIGYALAWALIFEGLFSSLYHLCPSRLTFQFDTAFMFVIAGLIVVLLYNGIEMPECSTNVRAKNRVAAANFFLYVLVPLYIFNYLGTMYHSEAGLITAVKIPFFVFLALWCVCMAVWAGCKLWKEISRDKTKTAVCILATFYIFGLLVPVVFLILLTTKNIDFPNAFLFTCIIESFFALLGKAFIEMNRFQCKGTCACTVEIVIHDFFQIAYVLATLGIGITALVFFISKTTTNKVKSPEKSRDLNQACYFLDFFDYHDMWHIFSSFALLMGALLVIHISYDPPRESGNRATAGNTPLLVRWIRYIRHWLS